MNNLPASDISMLTQLVVELPQLSFFFVVNLIATLCCVVYFSWRIFSNNFIAGRLSFCFAVFACIYYQIPLVIFSHQLMGALQNPWYYSLVVNGVVLLLAIYGFTTRYLDLKMEIPTIPENQPKIYLAAGLLAVIALSVYLKGIPWACTGMYALLYDPWLTLLAREFSIKLIGTSLATYSFGAYANTLAPIFVLFMFLFVRHSVARCQYYYLALAIPMAFLAISFVLLSGTKGLLLPLFVMLFCGAYFWSKTWWARLLTVVISILFVGASLVSFEVFKERSSVVGASYDFAACSVKTGTCKKSLDILDSMKHRDYSLGLPSMFVKPIKSRLECLCDGTCSEQTSQAFALGLMRAGTLDLLKLGGLDAMQERSKTFLEAVFYRIFVTPFQVSVWNYMYSETESYEAWKTLPFAKRIFGESINIPELVYQKYGVVYSLGDRTSTSTAPTSFFLGYSATVGWIGFLIAVGCIIVLDIFLAKFAHFIRASLRPILIGVILIMSMNFMTSDFVTVLVSHGGIAGIVSLGIYSILLRKSA